MYQLLRLCKVVSCRSPRFQVPVRRPVVGEFLVKEISAVDSVRVIVKGMKKDRIYDFKELKSLFPASSVDAGIRAKAVIPGDPEGGKRHAGEKTGNGLSRPGHYSVRPGTRVVLMDSNLKGRILSAGRNVRIELEEGLVIDAEYGEFAVSDPEEEKLLSDSSIVSGAKVCPTARKSMPGNVRKTGPDTVEVDLHTGSLPGSRSVPCGRMLEFQMEYFRRVLMDNLRHRGMKITFIHGIGDGILRNRICRELDEVFALKCTYVSSPAVTVVTVR